MAREEIAGEAFPPSRFPQPGDLKYANNAILAAGRHFFTLAHELGHIYLDNGYHSTHPRHLMTNLQSVTSNIINGDKGYLRRTAPSFALIP